MTINLLIFNMTTFIGLVNIGQHQANELDQALIFAETDIRELRKQAPELAEWINRARDEGRLSCRAIGRKGTRSYNEFFDFLRVHQLPVTGFAGLAANAVDINKHYIYKAARMCNFPLTIIY